MVVPAFRTRQAGYPDHASTGRGRVEESVSRHLLAHPPARFAASRHPRHPCLTRRDCLHCIQDYGRRDAILESMYEVLHDSSSVRLVVRPLTRTPLLKSQGSPHLGPIEYGGHPPVIESKHSVSNSRCIVNRVYKTCKAYRVLQSSSGPPLKLASYRSYPYQVNAHSLSCHDRHVSSNCLCISETFSQL